jgi:hypothetical protein
MDPEMIESFRDHLGSANPARIFEHLMRTLVKEAGRVLRVREARDAFESILRQARKGRIQVIGTEPRNQVVMISAKDFCDLLIDLQEQHSFMDAIRALPGYNPPQRRLAFTERPRLQEHIGLKRAPNQRKT